jgi:hypothetical protein
MRVPDEDRLALWVTIRTRLPLIAKQSEETLELSSASEASGDAAGEVPEPRATQDDLGS